MRSQILETARAMVQAHGYAGMSFRDIAAAVGIKSASVHYHFPTKGDLGAALASLYIEQAQADLEAVLAQTQDRRERLARYAGLYRTALENGNRLCLIAALAADHAALPEPVRAEIAAFDALNSGWLARVLAPDAPQSATDKARAIHAAIAGAQLLARGEADVALFDRLVASYRAAGLIPA
jgi:TetR/AcrR family transcriptional repressor of nem operon